MKKFMQEMDWSLILPMLGPFLFFMFVVIGLIVYGPEIVAWRYSLP
jgi:hypothetical protein